MNIRQYFDDCAVDVYYFDISEYFCIAQSLDAMRLGLC